MNSRIFVRFFIAIIVLVGLYLVSQAAQHAPKLSMATLFFIIFCGAIKYAADQVRRVTWFSKWSMVRRVRRMRKVYLASPVVLALYSVCAVFFFGVPLAQAAGWITIGSVCVILAGIFLCVATIADWYTRLKYLLESKLAKRAILAIVGILGTTTIFTSNIIANHVVFSVSQADPAKMPDFVRLASTAVYPLSLALVVSGLLVLLMLMQSVMMIFGILITALFRQLTSAAPPQLGEKVEGIVYRLITGRRPPRSRSWRDKLTGTLPLFVIRPIGTGAIAMIVVSAGSAITRVGSYIPMPFMQQALVAIEYHTPHQCENVDSTAFISYQDDGYVSVATKVNEGAYRFTLKKCHS